MHVAPHGVMSNGILRSHTTGMQNTLHHGDNDERNHTTRHDGHVITLNKAAIFFHICLENEFIHEIDQFQNLLMKIKEIVSMYLMKSLQKLCKAAVIVKSQLWDCKI